MTRATAAAALKVTGPDLRLCSWKQLVWHPSAFCGKRSVENNTVRLHIVLAGILKFASFRPETGKSRGREKDATIVGYWTFPRYIATNLASLLQTPPKADHATLDKKPQIPEREIQSHVLWHFHLPATFRQSASKQHCKILSLQPCIIWSAVFRNAQPIEA